MILVFGALVALVIVALLIYKLINSRKSRRMIEYDDDFDSFSYPEHSQILDNAVYFQGPKQTGNHRQSRVTTLGVMRTDR